MPKKLFTALVIASYLFMIPATAAAQTETTPISEQSSQDASQESSAESSQQSSEESTAQSSENSSDQSSEESTAQSSASSSDSDPKTATVFVIIGAVVAVGLTVGGVILTVRASQVGAEEAIGLQDQIYDCGGKDFDELAARFGVEGRELVRANDELVAAGYAIVDDRTAADYLAALVLKLAERSPWIAAERAKARAAAATAL